MKKISIKQVVGLLLCTAFAAAIMASCTPSAGTGSTTSDTGSANSAAGTSSVDRVLKDDAVVDMQGYQFTIASPWLPQVMPKNATVQERLFFERKKEVEKEYNCKIKILPFYGDMNNMTPKILADDKVADVIDMASTMFIPAAGAGYLVPWDDVQGIDLNDARWVDAYTNMGKVGEKHYGVNFIRPAEVRSCIFYNKDVLKASGITEDLQQLVYDGKWTFDKMREIALAVTKDTNNDGTPDRYGILQDHPYNVAMNLIMANGGRFVKYDSAKKTFATSYMEQPVLDALEYYNRLVNTDKVVYLWGYESSEMTWNNLPATETYIESFVNGKAAFMFGDSWMGNQQLKPKSDQFNYGILPMPKGPSASDYVTPSLNGRVFVATKTNKELDKTATIFNALARPLKGYEGEEWWVEDLPVEYFNEGDTKSAEMYEFILNKSSIDIGWGVGTIVADITYSTIAQAIYWNNGTPASMLATFKDVGYEDTVKVVLEKIK